jgi:hypothetical protein
LVMEIELTICAPTRGIPIGSQQATYEDLAALGDTTGNFSGLSRGCQASIAAVQGFGKDGSRR